MFEIGDKVQHSTYNVCKVIACREYDTRHYDIEVVEPGDFRVGTIHYGVSAGLLAGVNK